MSDIWSNDRADQFPLERVTRGYGVIDTNHAQVHAGNGFSFGVKSALAQAAVDIFTLTVPSNAFVHFQALSIDTDGGNDLTVELFDQAILAAAPGGTLITPNQHHRGGMGLRATGTLTLAANPSDGDTMTVGSRTYTFKDPFVDAANNIDIGANAAGTVSNIVAAITAGAGAGTAYGTGTAVHADVTAFDGTGDTVGFMAKARGTGGNALATTETFANAGNVFAAATLTGGTADNLLSRLTLDSALTVRKNPTVQYIGYDTFDTIGMFKQGAGANVTAAKRDSEIEWVLKPGATLAVRFTNTGSGVGTVNYSFRPFWYEEVRY